MYIICNIDVRITLCTIDNFTKCSVLFPFEASFQMSTFSTMHSPFRFTPIHHGLLTSLDCTRLVDPVELQIIS